ncbi:hypothetical protein U9M48_021881, partial [Paspalum notatum var. saurae]
NIERALEDAFKPLGISDWNSIFWVILDQVELKINLDKEQMCATRHVLSDTCVLFILDEMRKSSTEDGQATTGEGFDLGVLFGFGPALTVETVVFHSVSIPGGGGGVRAGQGPSGVGEEGGGRREVDGREAVHES